MSFWFKYYTRWLQYYYDNCNTTTTDLYIILYNKYLRVFYVHILFSKFKMYVLYNYNIYYCRYGTWGVFQTQEVDIQWHQKIVNKMILRIQTILRNTSQTYYFVLFEWWNSFLSIVIVITKKKKCSKNPNKHHTNLTKVLWCVKHILYWEIDVLRRQETKCNSNLNTQQNINTNTSCVVRRL